MALLFGELEAEAFNEDLLIDGVDVEKKDQGHQTEDGVVDLDAEECSRSLVEEGKGKSDDGKGEEEHDKDGVAPDPPIALFDLPEFGGQVVVGGLYGRGSSAIVEFAHRVEERVSNSWLNPS
jgi:hypothetical protein